MESTLIPAMLSFTTLISAFYLLSPKTFDYVFRPHILRVHHVVTVLCQTVHEIFKTMPERRTRSFVVHMLDWTILIAFATLLFTITILLSAIIVALSITVRIFLCCTILPLAPTLGKWRREQRDRGRETPVLEWCLDWLGVSR